MSLTQHSPSLKHDITSAPPLANVGPGPPAPALAYLDLVQWLAWHWLLLINVILGLFVGLPWLAPIFMAVGLETPARAIYLAYSFVCHQLPQRSFFLFGRSLTYSLAQIQAVWPASGWDWLALRQFVGTPDMGWKVAWSDRMVTMYGALWLGGLAFAALRRRLQPLPIRWFVTLALPMVVDGTSHLMNDALRLGFRDDNAWLAVLTGHVLPATFYAGDGWGSFNSIMRLVTGLLFGLACIWLVYPYVERGIGPVQYGSEQE